MPIKVAIYFISSMAKDFEALSWWDRVKSVHERGKMMIDGGPMLFPDSVIAWYKPQ